jgi:hypothetical protein
MQKIQLHDNYALEHICRDDLIDKTSLRNIQTQVGAYSFLLYVILCNRPSNQVERECYTLGITDEKSTDLWIEKLAEEGTITIHKRLGHGHPEYADLPIDTFLVGIQTKFQREILAENHGLICLDSTHKTTAYGYSLFTLVTQDSFGNGVPVAYGIMSNGRTDTIAAWLKSVKKALNDIINFGTVMMDDDAAEHSAVATTFPTAQRLLCWWHVLKAWRNNLKRTYDPDGRIWEKLQYLLKESDNVVRDFDTIKGIASAEFNQYFERTWMNKKGRSREAYIETQFR